MIRVLFVCIHNSARSQMAEAFLNDLGAGSFIAESAGIDASTINPLIVKVMREIGYDLSNKQTHSVFDYFQEGRKYDVLIKVCDQVHGQKCPIFPSVRTNLSWNFSDPAEFQASEQEKLEMARELRDQIKDMITAFIRVYQAG